MASGCIVISENIHKQNLIDLDMEKAIIQVNSPLELKQKLQNFGSYIIFRILIS